jgi:hypothetical protein
MADKTVTVGPSKTYATIQAALAAEAADLTSASYYLGGPGRLIVECYNQEDTTTVDPTGQTWVTDGDYYVWLQAVENHGGKYGTSSYRLKPSGSGIGIAMDADDSLLNLRVSGLILDGTNTTGVTANIGAGTAAHTGWMWLEKCILFGNSSSNHGVNLSNVDMDLYMSNCVVYGYTGTGVTGIRWNAQPWGYIYNCTIDDCDIGINTVGTKTVLKNTRITNCATSICNGEDIAADSDYNLTDESTTIPSNWGTNSIDGNDTPTINYVDDTNATLTSRDYHLTAGDSGIGAGTDLSGDAVLSFTDDIDGETRG